MTEEEIAEYNSEVESLADEIAERCDNAKIKYELSYYEEDDGTTEADLYLKMPCGRKTREINIWGRDDLESLASIKFENFKLLGNYVAIYDSENNVIESVVTPGILLRRGPFGRIAFFKRLGIRDPKKNNFKELTIKNNESETDIIITFGKTSSELLTLTQSGSPIGLSIFIRGFTTTTHDAALKLMEKMTNSLFFEIDVTKGVQLSNLRDNPRKRSKIIKKNNIPIRYPKNEYDNAPMSLYWYARSAVNMPLLQFLAFYQAIEYYYPAYFNASVSRKISSIIKNPAFRAEKNTDIVKIISTIQSNSGSRGSEKKQLKATLNECINEDEIITFIENDEDRKKFFLSKSKGITSHTINIKNKGTSLIEQIAERIYDIRCKIVHTKEDHNGDDIELLLPYSKEAENLNFDIELVQFIAQQVLISSSSSM